MNSPSINKDLKNYINSDILIYRLNIPNFSNLAGSSFPSEGDNLSVINERLNTLLRLPHQQFWCHTLFDHSILRSLQSFLNDAKRPHELLLEKSDLSTLEKESYKLYYRLILRLTTHKEVDIPEFSSANFGTLLYDNYIIDVPTIFDICSVFGEENPAIVSKLVCGIISSQKLYKNDIKDYIYQSNRLLNEKLSHISSNGFVKTGESIKSKVNQHLLTKGTDDKEDCTDLLCYVIDWSRGWLLFLNSVDSNEEIFDLINAAQFHRVVENVFEKIVPFSQQKMNRFDWKDPERLKTLLNVVCYYLIGVWRKIFEALFVGRLGVDRCKDRLSDENYAVIGECVAMVSACQENALFADALYAMYPLKDDIEMIDRAVRADKNEFYSEYIGESINEVLKTVKSRHTLFSNPTPEINRASSSITPAGTDANNATSDGVSQVRAIFPELSSDDISAYMKSYKCSADTLLESLLDGAIDLAYVRDVSANYVNEEFLARAEEDVITESILRTHRNIYDGDELDTGNVTRSQIHQGKRQTHLSSFIDPNLKSMILNIVLNQDEDERGLPANDNGLYNDEFDDVYGIGHDGVLDAKPTEDDVVPANESAAPPKRANSHAAPPYEKAHKLTPGPNASTSSPSDGASAAPVLMQPSSVGHSRYTSSQFKKKRYQDHQQQQNGSQGPRSFRQGSHGAPADRPKKDHRPKGARNNID